MGYNYFGSAAEDFQKGDGIIHWPPTSVSIAFLKITDLNASAVTVTNAGASAPT
jgi:hypothetical protein